MVVVICCDAGHPKETSYTNIVVGDSWLMIGYWPVSGWHLWISKAVLFLHF